EPVARALAPDPASRFESARELCDALRAVICPSGAGVELDVVALYAEGASDVVARCAEIAQRARMAIALSAPDSVLAVAPRDRIEIAKLKMELSSLGLAARIALGTSRATIEGSTVDGPALDVEGWAPYPLSDGLWVADGV
ncbi:MAG: hypothetical protein ACTHU0_28345, partial [Kofleriaceae bacterium]